VHDGFSIGSLISAEGRRYCIAHFRSDGRIDLLDFGDGTDRTVTQDWLQMTATVIDHAPRDDLAEISEAAWQEALTRFQHIAPVLATTKNRNVVVAAAAQAAGVDRATIFRWVSRFAEFGTISALVRKPRSDREQTRTVNAVESLLIKVLKQYFLTEQQVTIKHGHRELARLCREAELPVPSFSTFYRRVQGLSTVERVSAREGKSGKRRMRQVVASFPGADFPYSTLQIDHTVVDVVLVDEVNREELPRPRITVAIDVYSRMIAGYYISFDPPGVIGTAMCIAMAILPKDQFLRDHELNAEYPCRGFPARIHLDNAAEFRGEAMNKACQEYGINLEYRPCLQPNYGGHIERLVGTLMTEVHALPGTTRSRSTDLKGYNPQKEAAMTLAEFERWFGNLVVAYHYRPHSALDEMPPIERYRQAIFGSDTEPGIGLPPVPTGPEAIEKFRLDFMPLYMRTVQRDGIELDGVHYQGPVLRPWVEAKEPGSAKKKRKFIVRRDPRDISCIWFLDPQIKRYFRIPYKDPRFPPISVWELRRIKKYLIERGRSATDDNVIFAAYNEMRRVEQQSVEETKRVRVEAEKQRSRKRKLQETGLQNPASQQARTAPTPTEDDDDDLPLQRFTVRRP